MQYWTCPLCGANLDLTEKCDCEEQKKKQQENESKMFRMNHTTGQYEIQLDELIISHM